jgi:hypothetical protein
MKTERATNFGVLYEDPRKRQPAHHKLHNNVVFYWAPAVTFDFGVIHCHQRVIYLESGQIVSERDKFKSLVLLLRLERARYLRLRAGATPTRPNSKLFSYTLSALGFIAIHLHSWRIREPTVICIMPTRATLRAAATLTRAIDEKLDLKVEEKHAFLRL